MAVERFIDYMQFSAYFQESNAIQGGFEPVNPIAFYKRGYRDKYGIRYYFEPAKGKKCLVIASGQAMENLRSLRNDYEILLWGIDAGAKFSRIDLAVTEWNTFDGLFTVRDVQRWITEDLVESTLLAGGSKLVGSIRKRGEFIPETLYVGDMEKRGKRGIFRAYDKGIQLNLGEYMATRVELELKRDKAHVTAVRISKTNDIAGNFRASFNVRSKDFERLMDADAVKTSRGKAMEKQEENEKLSKRWEWLIAQVAPALREAIELDRKFGLGDTRMNSFIQASGLGDEMSKEVNARNKHFINQAMIQLSSKEK